jgi:hypothetical protein
MDQQVAETPSTDATTFAEQAHAQRPSVSAELVDFLRNSKKWWLTPIVLFLVIMGVLVFLSGTAAAPFIYTLF